MGEGGGLAAPRGCRWPRGLRDRLPEGCGSHYTVVQRSAPHPKSESPLPSIQHSLRVPEQLDREISREIQFRGEA